MGNGNEHTAVQLIASALCVCTIGVGDESEALGPLGFSVPGKENSGDTTEPLEEIPQLLFLCQLADLLIVKEMLELGAKSLSMEQEDVHL